MNKAVKSTIVVFVILASLLFFQASKTGTSIVMLPSEILAQKLDNMKRIRVAGRVADTEIKYQVEPEIKLEFSIIDPETEQKESVEVLYMGLKPDMFAVGRDVIIDGEIVTGKLHAKKLLTQCPSKYEPPAPK